MIIKGKPCNEEEFYINNVKIEGFANLDRLASLIKGASLVICRSGYSSLMDLNKLKVKNVLLVPTPGQTEQEYLAVRLSETATAIVQKQSKLD